MARLFAYAALAGYALTASLVVATIFGVHP